MVFNGRFPFEFATEDPDALIGIPRGCDGGGERVAGSGSCWLAGVSWSEASGDDSMRLSPSVSLDMTGGQSALIFGGEIRGNR